MKKNAVRHFLIILFFFSFIPAISGQPLIVPSDLNSKVPLGKIEFFEDKTGFLRFEDILNRPSEFLPNIKKQACFGLSTSTYWIKISVQNITDKPIRFYFEYTYPVIDNLDVLFKTEKETVRYMAGDFREFDIRPIPYPTPLFPVEQAPGVQDYYFKISGDSLLKAAFKIWDPKKFEHQVPPKYLIAGLNVGILFSVILYNVIAFIWQRKWIYFWFSCCSITGTLTIMYSYGFLYQILAGISPPIPEFYNYLYVFLHHISIFFWLLFFSCFITEQTMFYRTAKMLTFGAFLIILTYFIPGFKIKILTIPPYHLICFSIMYILFIINFRKQKPYLLIIAGLTIHLFFIFLPIAEQTIPPLFSGLSFLLITVGMVVYSNEFNLEKQELMLSIQRAENVKSEFIHSVAHNLKTPLVALMFSSQMLKKLLETNKEAQHFLDKILRNATWLSNFIENFFEFYKNDKFELNIKEVSLKSLINSIVGELGDINKYRHNILFNQSEDKDPYLIDIDKSIIEQVLLNVVENAIKYSTIENEKGTIIIDISRQPNEMIICIADNGIGISKKAMKNIYDAFFRANEDDQYGGTGLGLTISKKFIDAHNGRLYCISPAPKDHSQYLYLDSNRKGAVFYIHLPTNLKDILATEEDK